MPPPGEGSTTAESGGSFAGDLDERVDGDLDELVNQPEELLAVEPVNPEASLEAEPMATTATAGAAPAGTAAGGVGESSFGSTPAKPQKVGYQSTMCMRTSLRVPRTAAGSSPPETNAATRIPPS